VRCLELASRAAEEAVGKDLGEVASVTAPNDCLLRPFSDFTLVIIFRSFNTLAERLHVLEGEAGKSSQYVETADTGPCEAGD
jgi:hypothetical protein